MSEFTIIYLIRHSKKLNNKILDNTKNHEYYQTRREKIVLSIEGERRAKILSEINELRDIDIILSSNYVRTIQTAKYLAENRNILIQIDDNFNERKLGIKQNEIDISIEQYLNEKIKNPEGECREEVVKRMKESFWNVVDENRGKKIAIFTHQAAMTFLLMEWCKLEYIKENKHICLSFKNKKIIDKVFDAPELFEILIDQNNKIAKIRNINLEF